MEQVIGRAVRVARFRSKKLTHVRRGEFEREGKLRLSIDRIDNNLGYAEGNVRLVCLQVNYMRGDLTDDIFFAMCKLIVARNEKVAGEK